MGTNTKKSLYGDDLFAALSEHDPEDMTVYQGRPADYIQEVLGDTLTTDQIKVCQVCDDARITIMMASTSVGKSHLEARLAVYFLDVYPNSKVFVCAAPPLSNLMVLLWRPICKIFKSNPELMKRIGARIRTNGIYTPDDEHYIQCITIPREGSDEEKVAAASGKHAPVIVFLTDEADAIPDPIFEGINGCMTGGQARLICSFNPKRKNGYVYDLIESGRAMVVPINSLNHPNVVTGKDLFPGAVTRDTVLTGINEWSDPVDEIYDPENHPSDVFFVPDYLVGCVGYSDRGTPYPPLRSGWRKIIDTQICYKILGRFPPDDEQSLIPAVYLEAAISRYLAMKAQGLLRPKEIRPIIGYDPGGETGDPHGYIEKWGFIWDNVQEFQGIQYEVGAERVADEAAELDARAIHVDGVGLGMGSCVLVKKRLQEKKKEEISVVKVNSGKKKKRKYEMTRDELYMRLRWMFLNEPVAMPPDKELRTQLSIVKMSENNSGRIVVTDKKTMRRLLGGKSPNKMEAMVMTVGTDNAVGGTV